MVRPSVLWRRRPTESRATHFVLDIGSQHTRLVKASVARRRILVSAVAEVPSEGFDRGQIVHMDRFVETLRAVLDASGDLPPCGLFSVPFPLGRLETAAASLDLGDRLIDQRSLLALGEIFREAARAHNPDARPLHILPQTYKIDDLAAEIRNPLGLTARTLHCRGLVALLPFVYEKHFTEAFRRSFLAMPQAVLDIVGTAAGCFWATPNEPVLTILDMGAAHTHIIILKDGRIAFAESLPYGGDHLTADIARAFNMEFSTAEQLKLSLGGAALRKGDEAPRTVFLSAGRGGAPFEIVPAALKNAIIKPMQELLEDIRIRITQSPYPLTAQQRLILTGGGAQLPDITALAESVLGGRAALGIGPDIPGLPKESRWNLCCGLLLYAQQQAEIERLWGRQAPVRPLKAAAAYLRWFLNHF